MTRLDEVRLLVGEAVEAIGSGPPHLSPPLQMVSWAVRACFTLAYLEQFLEERGSGYDRVDRPEQLLSVVARSCEVIRATPGTVTDRPAPDFAGRVAWAAYALGFAQVALARSPEE